jgi:hypothetical protein
LYGILPDYSYKHLHKLLQVVPVVNFRGKFQVTKSRP